MGSIRNKLGLTHLLFKCHIVLGLHYIQVDIFNRFFSDSRNLKMDISNFSYQLKTFHYFLGKFTFQLNLAQQIFRPTVRPTEKVLRLQLISIKVTTHFAWITCPIWNDTNCSKYRPNFQN